MSARQPASITDGTVTVFHPSRILNAYQAALALQENGSLNFFETGFYYKENSFIRAVLAVLPDALAARVYRELERRIQPGLNPERIRLHAFWDVLFTLSARLLGSSSVAEWFMLWRNKRFDSAIAARVLKERPAAVYGYDTTALYTFGACNKTGTLKILEQVIGHCKIGFKILAQERELHPEFADSIAFNSSEHLVQRALNEVLSADYILAPSEYVKQTLLEVGCAAEKIFILPYGVDIQRFTPMEKRQAGPFRILFTGQISQRKGIKYLLEAFKNLRLPNAELTLLGPMIGAETGLNAYAGLFKHLPSVPHAQIHELFQQADIFVFPSLHEGSALVTYEAMASGLPIVTTPNAGSIARDGEEGFIIPIRDIAALEDKILRLYKDLPLRKNMGQKARQRAEMFTWATYRSKLARIVSDVISGRAGTTYNSSSTI